MKIGKATISIDVEGCIQCGAKWSSGWSVAKVVPVVIGKKSTTIELHICTDCQEANKTQVEQFSFSNLNH